MNSAAELRMTLVELLTAVSVAGSPRLGSYRLEILDAFVRVLEGREARDALMTNALIDRLLEDVGDEFVAQVIPGRRV